MRRLLIFWLAGAATGYGANPLIVGQLMDTLGFLYVSVSLITMAAFFVGVISSAILFIWRSRNA